MGKKPNIKAIKKTLNLHGFTTEKIENFLRIKINTQGAEKSLDFFILDPRMDPQQAHNELKLNGQAPEPSCFFGCRGKKHFYFAKIKAPLKQAETSQNNELIEKTIANLKTVDSKMFRKSLDNLGLSRSGLVRMALTRIYRAGTDPLELTITIAEEAERISNTDEVEAINILRNTSNASFITDMAQLLWETIALYRLKAQ